MRRRSGFGLFELIIGVLLIALAVPTFARPEGLLTGVVVIYGIFAIFTGIEDILIYARVSRFIGFGPMLSLITGILSVMSGIMILAYPDAGKWALSILFPMWFIAHCVSQLARIGMARIAGRYFYYYFSLITNIIGIVLGFMMIASPSLSFMTMQTMCYIVAFYLLLLGIEGVVSGIGRITSRW